LLPRRTDDKKLSLSAGFPSAVFEEGPMRRTFVTGFLLVVLAFAGLSAASAEPPKGDPAWSAIEKAGKAFAEAYGRGDITAVANFYAADAAAFPPDGNVVEGRLAIEGLWRGFRETGAKSIAFEVLDVVSSGILAAETGIASMNVQAMGGTGATVKVKYVVVWKKVGGAWKIYRDIWNALPAPPSTTPAPTSP
jgi:ketosteroid isomerase-like protein